MSVLAEFTVPADDFVLAETLAAAPEMTIEIKRVAAGKTHVTPYFWASGGNFRVFDDALRDDEMVLEVLTLEEHDDTDQLAQDVEERFYRVVWEADVPNLIQGVAAVKATVLDAVTSETGREWEVKVLFPDESALSTFNEYSLEHDLTYEARRLYRPEKPADTAEFDVTDAQQEALEAAYHGGYFAIPRDQTLTELADSLNISRNALSARLRRGHRNLLEQTIIHDGSGDT
ncbi:putative DNA binding protein [Halovivax ruber XH-70]|uniref:Putative DNA binding protein n=1 Tax=Halovivax ruber (strain DSM 18193 / JCM 13892 / XH-70) TaxID=797302 RepID=L0IG70_HALRX|nr:helix-turn-helix domain-containing protein [Halovivax ruber]AGB16977.1 putative DNA binding protein [Halovivax ruber XH-70]